MRKINSEYKTAFVSEAGSELINNDFFGFVELEDFACYVVADGLYKGADAESAKLAIDTVVRKFLERPSLKKRALQGYLKAANTRLLNSGKTRQRLKTSITVVVTNYEKMRYASAGNTRMYLYRGGHVLAQTADTSYAQQLVTKEGSSQDKLSRHRERNNLHTYLGQKSGFAPRISKKIKLQESDVITLFSRGIWENVEDSELLDVFSEVGNDPREAVDNVEELLLSRQPKELENYTFAAIFVNKVFEDPNRKKRIRKIIIISVVAVVLLAIIILVIFFWNRNRQQIRADMEDHLTRVVTLVEQGNYSRALTDAEEADALARRLRDRDRLAEIDTYMQLIQAVLFGDSLLDDGRYQEAQDAFRRAIRYARDAEVGYADINRRLEVTEEYINFFALMELGDSLVARGSYERALYYYARAREQASALFFSAGRQQALDAIADVHERMTRAAEAAAADAAEEREADRERAAALLAAAELIAQGDRHFAVGDYVAARAFYQMAREMYQELEDGPGIATATGRIALAESRLMDRQDQEALAAEFAAQGDRHFAAGDYLEARRYYTLARQIYDYLGMTWRVTHMDNQLELVRQAIERAEAEADAGRPPWIFGQSLNSPLILTAI